MATALKPIGIIGLGSLGLPVAVNILKSGRDVLGYRRQASTELADAGGESAASIADIGRRCEVIVTCLPSAEALAEVVSGQAGLVARIRPNAVVIDLSAVPISVKTEQRRSLSTVGAAMLDCGVSGNRFYVADRSAGLFASGDRPDFDRCATVLSAITDHVSYVGSFGAGTTMKMIASMLVPIHTLAAAEALSFAARAGIDLQTVFDAIKGTQASSAMFETRGARMLAGTHAGPALAAYHRRNIAMTLEAARDLGGRYPLLNAVDACYRAATRAGFGDLDQSALFDFLMAWRTGDARDAESAGPDPAMSSGRG